MKKNLLVLFLSIALMLSLTMNSVSAIEGPPPTTPDSPTDTADSYDGYYPYFGSDEIVGVHYGGGQLNDTTRTQKALIGMNLPEWYYLYQDDISIPDDYKEISVTIWTPELREEKYLNMRIDIDGEDERFAIISLPATFSRATIRTKGENILVKSYDRKMIQPYENGSLIHITFYVW